MSIDMAKRPPDCLFRMSTDRFTQPFWDAAAGHRLTACKCGQCGHYRMPPTPFCPQCHSQRVVWEPLSGRGAVFSYTVVTHAILPEMQSHLPYVPAVISLEGADRIRLISNVVDVPVASVVVGMQVAVVWDAVNGVIVPRFTST
jgi:uncharacterized OB-fold protein